VALLDAGRVWAVDMVDVATERRDPLIAGLLEDERFDERRSFSNTRRP